MGIQSCGAGDGRQGVYIQSGPTPRGRDDSAAATAGARAVPRSRRASSDVLLILGRIEQRMGENLGMLADCPNASW